MSDSRNAKHLAARSVARWDSKPERLGMGGPHRKIHLENHGVDGVVSLPVRGLVSMVAKAFRLDGPMAPAHLAISKLAPRKRVGWGKLSESHET